MTGTAGTVVRVVAYIDGFNLYHGMHGARSRRGLWLDLESMLESMLRPGQRLERVHYFTALVVGSGRGPQQVYLDALRAHCRRTELHVARFQEKRLSCRRCGDSWRSYEEKESDVSLAVQVIEDAARDLFDMALLVSGDSDMRPAVDAVRRIAPHKRLLAVFPPRRSSHALEQATDACLRIFDRLPERHLLPDIVTDGSGRKLVRPVRWR